MERNSIFFYYIILTFWLMIECNIFRIIIYLLICYFGWTFFTRLIARHSGIAFFAKYTYSALKKMSKTKYLRGQFLECWEHFYGLGTELFWFSLQFRALRTWIFFLLDRDCVFYLCDNFKQHFLVCFALLNLNPSRMKHIHCEWKTF